LITTVGERVAWLNDTARVLKTRRVGDTQCERMINDTASGSIKNQNGVGRKIFRWCTEDFDVFVQIGTGVVEDELIDLCTGQDRVVVLNRSRCASSSNAGSTGCT